MEYESGPVMRKVLCNLTLPWEANGFDLSTDAMLVMCSTPSSAHESRDWTSDHSLPSVETIIPLDVVVPAAATQLPFANETALHSPGVEPTNVAAFQVLPSSE